MKKILTLVIAFGAIASVQAQSNRSYPTDDRYGRDVILGDRNDRYEQPNRTYENNSRYTYSMSASERDRKIKQINNDYDRRVKTVEKDRRMRSYEKQSQIRQLENQRRDEIRLVWERFRNSNNTHRDNSYQQNNRRW